MKLTLTQTELELAVKSYVEQNGLSLEDKDVQLTFTEQGCEINLNPVEKPKRTARKTVTKTEEKTEEKSEEVVTSEPVEETQSQESDLTNHTDESVTSNETPNTTDNPFALFGN